MRRLPLISFAAVLAAASAAYAGPAVNQFEVEGLEVEQGEVEIQLQSDFASGFPRRKSAVVDGDTVFDDNEIARQRHELELALGLTNWLKIWAGLEWEEERFDDPATFAEASRFADLEWTEVSVGALAVIIPVRENGIGLGTYYDLQVSRGEESQTLFSGLILEAHSGAWSATGNFALVKYIGGTPEEGEARDEKLDFAYFTQVKYDFNASWGLALEAYGTIDRLGSSGTASDEAIAIGDQDQHRIGPVVYYSFKAGGSAAKAASDEDEDTGGDNDDEGTGVTLSAGVLFGLNGDTPDTTIKTGLEVEF